MLLSFKLNVPSTCAALYRVSIARLLGLALLLAALSHNPAAAEPVKILAFGDSLTAGYGLPEAETLTAQLSQALAKMGREAAVINGGVSGDTTAGGVSRIDWALADQPKVMILALGGNDMLRGIDPASTRSNLEAVITKAQAAGVEIVLAGMLAPPNLGPEYGDEFNRIYPELATRHDVPLYPFFLDGVAAEAALNQGDGMHPNAAGVRVIVERVLPDVIRLIERARGPAQPG